MNKNHKWMKVDRGYYVLPGTPYAVMSDGYERHDKNFFGGEWAAERVSVADGGYEGFIGVNDPEGICDNLAWFSTMREAKAHIEALVA